MINRSIGQRSRYAFSAALFIFAGTPVAMGDPSDPVNPLKKRFLTGKPLEICDQGGFYVGGVPKIPTTGAVRQTIIGSMYTQFQIPAKHHRWPIIFVHGGNYTGSAMDATPDGREGWLSHAVRKNYATFVVDRPGYGRSGFDSTVLNEARARNDLSILPAIAEATSDTWYNTGQRGFGIILPSGADIISGKMIRHGDPGDPRIPETNPPSDFHGAYPPAYPIPPVDSSIDANIEARIGAIGPAPNPANNSYLALSAYKWIVPGMDNLFPGSVCATCIPNNISPGNTWAPLALAELVERLGGAIVSPHSQSSDNVLHMVRILKERGKLNLVKGIIVPETTVANTEVPNFPFERFGLVPSDFDNIPYLILSGDYRITSIRTSNQSFINALNASPTRRTRPAAYYDLDSQKLGDTYLGTTHIVHLGTNNIELLDFMFDWADRNINNPVEASLCPEGSERPKHWWRWLKNHSSR